MKYLNIARSLDHSILGPCTLWSEVRQALDDGIKYHAACVCMPACYIAQAREYAGDAIPLCTVAGFPHGNSTSAAKAFEVREAVSLGADEVDVVLQVAWLRENRQEDLLDELNLLRAACRHKTLKIVVEAGLLTDREKITACELAAQCGADYLCTSSGFSGAGATLQDMLLFTRHLPPHVKIKSSGGIVTLDDAQRFLDLGATRLGSSRLLYIFSKLDMEGH